MAREPNAAPPCVLVAHADAGIRALYRRVLAVERVDVLEVADGYDALLTILHRPPQLVIADLHLPLLDGLALCGMLRRHQATTAVPVIIMAADHQPAAVSRAGDAGADLLLPKQLAIEAIVREARRLLAERHTGDDAVRPAVGAAAPLVAASLEANGPGRGAGIATSPRPANRVLRALPDAEFRILAPHLSPVSLERRRVLHHAGEQVDRVIFPNDGVVSLVTPLDDGGMIEAATVGRRGIVGMPGLWSPNGTSPFDTVVQVAGADALAIRTEDLRRQLHRLVLLPQLIDEWTRVLVAQLAQSNACNAVHTVQQRCARWLLTTRDHLCRDEFLLSHEFLAQMLGVQRPTVSTAAASLQDAGLIRYSRGQLRIVDAGRLHAMACECYDVVRRHLDGLRTSGTPHPPSAHPGAG